MSPGRPIIVASSLGYDDDLLYWKPVLDELDETTAVLVLSAANSARRFRNGNVEIRPVRSFRLRLGRRTKGYERGALLPDVLQLWRAVRNEDPSTIVVSEFTPISVAAVAIAARFTAARIVLLVESDPTIDGKFPLSRLKKMLRRRVVARAGEIVTNNRSGARHLISLGAEPTTISVAPYVTSEAPAAADDQFDSGPESDGPLRVLVVGQVTERKGPVELIDALVVPVQQALPAMEVRWIGDGDLLDECRQRARSAKAPVRFVGHVPYQELAVEYRAADVVLVPTLRDYRALVGFEALHHGVPTIHSIYDGAAAEVTRPGVNGFLYDPYDPTTLHHALHALADPTTRRSFSEQAAAKSLEFTATECVATLRRALADPTARS